MFHNRISYTFIVAQAHAFCNTFSLSFYIFSQIFTQKNNRLLFQQTAVVSLYLVSRIFDISLCGCSTRKGDKSLLIFQPLPIHYFSIIIQLCQTKKWLFSHLFAFLIILYIYANSHIIPLVST